MIRRYNRERNCEDHLKIAREVDLNVVLEFGKAGRAKKVIEKCGLTNYVQVKVTDFRFGKRKGVPVTGERIAKAVTKAKDLLS